MSDVSRDLRDDLLAATAARRELSAQDEEYLIDNFLTRLDREIEARVDARIDARIQSMPRRRGMEPWVIPAALGIAIPICAIAASLTGVWGLLIALIFILSVLGIYAGANQS